MQPDEESDIVDWEGTLCTAEIFMSEATELIGTFVDGEILAVDRESTPREILTALESAVTSPTRIPAKRIIKALLDFWLHAVNRNERKNAFKFFRDNFFLYHVENKTI